MSLTNNLNQNILLFLRFDTNKLHALDLAFEFRKIPVRLKSKFKAHYFSA